MICPSDSASYLSELPQYNTELGKHWEEDVIWEEPDEISSDDEYDDFADEDDQNIGQDKKVFCYIALPQLILYQSKRAKLVLDLNDPAMLLTQAIERPVISRMMILQQV